MEKKELFVVQGAVQQIYIGEIFLVHGTIEKVFKELPDKTFKEDILVFRVASDSAEAREVVRKELLDEITHAGAVMKGFLAVEEVKAPGFTIFLALQAQCHCG